MRFDFGSGVKGKFYVNGMEFVATDEDTAGAVKYYGFTAYTRQWIIMQEDDTVTTAVTYRFASGTTSYAVGWTGRGGLTYKTFDLMTVSF
jgi:hypothetical protein